MCSPPTYDVEKIVAVAELGACARLQVSEASNEDNYHYLLVRRDTGDDELHGFLELEQDEEAWLLQELLKRQVRLGNIQFDWPQPNQSSQGGEAIPSRQEQPFVNVGWRAQGVIAFGNTRYDDSDPSLPSLGGAR